MRRVASIVASLLTVAVLAQPAGASQPVPGGRYLAKVHPQHGTTVDVDVKLANDGKEFAEVSAVWFEVGCGDDATLTHLELSDEGSSGRSAQVGRRGRFGAEDRLGAYLVSIRGRFVARGRRMIGTAVFRDSDLCHNVRARFAARLVARPNAPSSTKPSTCDWVGVAYRAKLGFSDGYVVRELGAGCTTAREFARDWHADPICRHIVIGETCAIPGATCEAIRGGRLLKLAGARCVADGRPSSAVELVHELPCTPPRSPGSDTYATAINLDCTEVTAFSVMDMLGDYGELEGPCDTAESDVGERVRCTPVRGFTCVARATYYDPDGYLVALRCTRDTDPFHVFIIEVDF